MTTTNYEIVAVSGGFQVKLHGGLLWGGRTFASREEAEKLIAMREAAIAAVDPKTWAAHKRSQKRTK